MLSQYFRSLVKKFRKLGRKPGALRQKFRASGSIIKHEGTQYRLRGKSSPSFQKMKI